MSNWVFIRDNNPVIGERYINLDHIMVIEPSGLDDPSATIRLSNGQIITTDKTVDQLIFDIRVAARRD